MRWLVVGWMTVSGGSVGCHDPGYRDAEGVGQRSRPEAELAASPSDPGLAAAVVDSVVRAYERWSGQQRPSAIRTILTATEQRLSTSDVLDGWMRMVETDGVGASVAPTGSSWLLGLDEVDVAGERKTVRVIVWRGEYVFDDYAIGDVFSVEFRLQENAWTIDGAARFRGSIPGPPDPVGIREEGWTKQQADDWIARFEESRRRYAEARNQDCEDVMVKVLDALQKDKWIWFLDRRPYQGLHIDWPWPIRDRVKIKAGRRDSDTARTIIHESMHHAGVGFGTDHLAADRAVTRCPMPGRPSRGS